MRLSQVIRFYTSQFKCNKLSDYHNRGRPKRVLKDDGSNYFDDPNVSMKEQHYRQKLKRLNDLEQLQLAGSTNSHKASPNSKCPKASSLT